MMFTQSQGDAMKQDNHKCYRCRETGHISRNCPAKKPIKEQMHTMMCEDGKGQYALESNYDKLDSKTEEADGMQYIFLVRIPCLTHQG